MKSESASGAMPTLLCSPARLTSISTLASEPAWRSSWASADSLATEWISLTSGRTDLTLRLCRLPMKSQTKRSPQRSRLASRSWSRFSPTSSTPPSASAPISSTGTYLVAARISTPEPARSRTRSRLRRTTSGSRSRSGSTIADPFPDQTGLPPSPAVVATVREEQLRLAARAEPRRLDLVHAGPSEQAVRDLGQIEHASVRDAFAERGEGVAHLVAD